MTDTTRTVGYTTAAALSILALSSSACAHAGAAPAATAKETREQATVSIEYAVSRKGQDDGVLLRGRTSIDERHEARVEHRAKDREDLRFAARERSDGSFDVEMKYRETSPDGPDITWEPVLRIARGATSVADVSGPGWARAVSVKVE